MPVAPPLELAVILARGLGTRMRDAGIGTTLETSQTRAAAAGLKAMMPFERPFLDYQLSRLADAGYRRAALVIGPEHGAVREHYARHPPRRLEITFAEQLLPRGTADAVLASEAVVGNEDFAVVNGDNLYPSFALAALRGLPGPGLVAFDAAGLSRGGNIPPERVRAFALVQVAANGTLADIVEKPDEATARSFGSRALVSMTCWRFSTRIFAACRTVEPSPRGELELPDAVRLAMVAGARFDVLACDEPVLDLSRREDIPAVARLLAGMAVEP